MSNWDFAELNKLCAEKGIPDAKKYQNSLNRRFQRANFYAEKASEIWSDLFKESFTFRDSRFILCVFEYEAQVESYVQALHSTGDILAQIINVLVLKNEFTEDKVSIIKVIDCMEKKKITPEIITNARKLLNDSWFEYISELLVIQSSIDTKYFRVFEMNLVRIQEMNVDYYLMNLNSKVIFTHKHGGAIF